MIFPVPFFTTFFNKIFLFTRFSCLSINTTILGNSFTVNSETVLGLLLTYFVISSTQARLSHVVSLSTVKLLLVIKYIW